MNSQNPDPGTSREDHTTRRKPSGWFLLALALWIPLTGYFVSQHAGKALDDFFVTFRYADNLVQGHGFVFNPGERVLGLTNPGLGLLLAGLHAVSRLSLPWLGTFVSGMSLLSLVLLLLGEAQKRHRAPEALLGGTLVLISGYVWANHSGAASIVLLLLVAAARLIETRPWLAGLLAGAAVWCRPDAGLGVGLLGLIWWIHTRRLPWRYGFAGAGMILGGALLAEIYYGSFIPVTLESKRLLAEMKSGTTRQLQFWPRAIPSWLRHGGPWALWIAALGGIGQLPLFRRSSQAGRLIVLYSAALALAYPLMGVAFFSWYTVPTAVAILYGFAFATGGTLRFVNSQAKRWRPASWLRFAGPLLIAALLTPLVIPYIQRSWASIHPVRWSPRLPAYQQAALWIRDHSEPTDSLTATEIGVLGFYSQRPLEDLLGMVNPKVFPFIPQRDFRGAFLSHPTEFVVAQTRNNQRSHLANIARSRWFRKAYREVARFDQTNGFGFVTVYQRKPNSQLPSPHEAPKGRKPQGRKPRQEAPRDRPQHHTTAPQETPMAKAVGKQ